MKGQTISRLLLGLALVAASAVADYTGASGGNIAITFPSLGATLNEGQSYAITWNAAGLYYPLVSIKLLSLTNGQPDSNNAITISDIVQTSSQAYNWKVGQGFSGGNVIQIGGLTSSAYSASFNIQAAASTSAVNSSMVPTSSTANLTSSSRPPNSTHSSTALTTAPPASLTTLPPGFSPSSSSSFNSSFAGNSTDPNASSSGDNPVPIIAVGITVGIVALAGALYLGLRKTRRRRRPVSMPLILDEAAEPKDWSPPDWTTHNTVPTYRKPPTADRLPLVSSGAPYAAGYAPTNGYSGSIGYSGGGYYADPAVPWASPAQSSAAIPEAGGSAVAVAVPEDAYIREKTAVAVGWKEELEGVVAGTDSEKVEALGKPHSAD